ncbi:MAG: family 1 glycosylhydrolase [Beijerinckiaceae bacterium]|nr:family 1 glycosylhydrolase [Beijerinckiaceae bacterium]
MMSAKLELWGGPECTVVRIGDQYRNQLAETGHQDRLGDLDLIADLGIKTLRYPVIWETVSPEDPSEFDWSWTDVRLARLRELGIEVIAGLIHHGSGPRYTHLLDPLFAEKLAVYARQVALRYPWIVKYTPVNEPLTTARFSGLYGHWHPHRRDYSAFLRALVNECRAIGMAMQAIRTVNPNAQLVQTEDLGKTFAPQKLLYQADHENERRWLSFDLLLGRVKPGHVFFDTLLRHGVSAAELEKLENSEGAPSIIGINYYATSDRYLEPELHCVPACFAGGNEQERYADVEAFRVEQPGLQLGAHARLTEAWERYGLPLAITEAHHGSTRDEQIRWLCELWSAAEDLRRSGVDVRAVTVWSMFGAVDWNSLLTKKHGFYEPGPFDIRGGAPRLTGLGHATKSLAENGSVDHPLLDQPGWWRREVRLYRGSTQLPQQRASRAPVLVLGANGTLGRAFARVCAYRGLGCVLLGRGDADITNEESVKQAVSLHNPWVVVNAAGYVRVNDAPRERNLCFDWNVTGAANVARVCASAGIQYVTFSSDLVFDGTLGRAYLEDDNPQPQCVYGASKEEAERQVLRLHPDALVVRTSAFFGPWDSSNFVWQCLNHLSEGRAIDPDDTVVSPTYVPDLVNATLDLLIDTEAGLWHLANDGMMSWCDLAELAAERVGINWKRTTGNQRRSAKITALTSRRGIILPKLDDAVARYFGDCEIKWTEGARA